MWKGKSSNIQKELYLFSLQAERSLKEIKIFLMFLSINNFLIENNLPY